MSNFITAISDKRIFRILRSRVIYWVLKGYDVILTNGTNVEFDKSGEWKEIEARHLSLSVLPERIADYIKKTFPDNTVVSVDKDT